jgi:hypothetical protein
MDDTMMRELFIEELTEVTGGGPDPLQKIKDLLGAETTQACCEEGQCCDYWS